MGRYEDNIQTYVKIMADNVEADMHHIFNSKYITLVHFGKEFNAYKNENSAKYWMNKFKKQEEAWEMSIQEFKQEINRLIADILT